jgi:hypothetical protein
VLTAFLLWPVLLACIMPLGFLSHLPTMIAYFLIVGLCCVTTAMTALFCSTVFHQSATSLICTYLVITVMFVGPLAARFFAESFFQGQDSAAVVEEFGVMSPFVATFSLPLEMTSSDDRGMSSVVSAADANLPLFFGHIAWSVVYNGVLLLAMIRLFQVRWRVAE